MMHSFIHAISPIGHTMEKRIHSLYQRKQVSYFMRQYPFTYAFSLIGQTMEEVNVVYIRGNE